MNRSLSISMLVIVVFSCLHASIIPLLGEETRYASVAWRMFMEHEWFIPRWGNHVYLQKTPLLFWCLQAGWRISVDRPWVTIIPLIFTFFTILYTQKLSQALFPNNPTIIFLSPLILIAMPFFIDQLGLLRFDMMLTCFNVMACYFLIRKQYWLFVLANGLGLLTKGPVIYLFTIPEIFLFSFYLPLGNIRRWLIGIILSLSILIIWWGPIIYQGQFSLIQAILSEQLIARVNGSKGVVKPIWDYLVLLPCFFLPWIFLPSFIKFKQNNEYDKKITRCLMQIFIICFIIFSLIKTKEARYLLPLTPLVAIFIATRLERSKIVFVFLLISIFVTSIIDLSVTYLRSNTQDLRPAIEFIHTLLVNNIPIVTRDPAMSDMQFLGRWQMPLLVRVREDKFQDWVKIHPNGWVITTIEKNTTQFYAHTVSGCFEQSYSHLHRVLYICPVFMVASYVSK